MNVEETKRLLEEIKTNPDSLKDDADHIDKLLMEIIRIEKKHLYGLDSTSNSRRQDEIKKLIDSNVS